MQINSASTQRVEKWIEVSITFKGKTFKVSVETLNGKVQGDGYTKFYTAYLTYFNTTSLEVRKKHFETIKKYVERYIK